jgi:Mg2+ and Co2+ transporter CorA
MTLADTGDGHNTWKDLVDPDKEELQKLSKQFNSFSSFY